MTRNTLLRISSAWARTGSSTGAIQPTGANILRYQDLSGADMNAKLNSATATKQVSFASGTFEWQDFSQNSTNSTSGMGLFLTNTAGLLGSGKTATVLRMTPGSTTKSTDMTPGGTTALQYIELGPNVKLVQDLTVQGVSLGTGSQYIYNGLFLLQINDFTMNRVIIRAIPGSNHVPPGETFGIDGYQGSNHTFNDVEIDGAGIGATAFGPNFHTGTYTLNNCNAHDNPYSAGIAAYKCSGTIQINNFRSANNHVHLNFEQNADGTVINAVSPRMGSSTSGQDVYTGSYTGSSKITIYDPVDDNGNPRTSLVISCATTYGAQNNSQLRSDIKVIVGGVDRTSSIVSWR